MPTVRRPGPGHLRASRPRPDPVAVGALCDPCLDIALAQADEYRARFETMIEAGVSRAEANRHLIAAIERRKETS